MGATPDKWIIDGWDSIPTCDSPYGRYAGEVFLFWPFILGVEYLLGCPKAFIFGFATHPTNRCTDPGEVVR